MNRKRKPEILEWIRTLLLGAIVVLVFRGMVAQAYQIPSGSMERTLLIGDYIYINKMLYGSETTSRFFRPYGQSSPRARAANARPTRSWKIGRAHV